MPLFNSPGEGQIKSAETTPSSPPVTKPLPQSPADHEPILGEDGFNPSQDPDQIAIHADVEEVVIDFHPSGVAQTGARDYFPHSPGVNVAPSALSRHGATHDGRSPITEASPSTNKTSIAPHTTLQRSENANLYQADQPASHLSIAEVSGAHIAEIGSHFEIVEEEAGLVLGDSETMNEAQVRQLVKQIYHALFDDFVALLNKYPVFRFRVTEYYPHPSQYHTRMKLAHPLALKLVMGLQHRILMGTPRPEKGEHLLVPFDRNIAEAAAKELVNYAVGLGPIQSFLEDPNVENINIGCYYNEEDIRDAFERSENILSQIATQDLDDNTVANPLDNAPHIEPRVRAKIISAGKVSVKDLDITVSELRGILGRVAAENARELSYSSPILDGILPDGSRINVQIPPVAYPGPQVSIRCHRLKQVTLLDLVKNKTLTDQAAALMALFTLAHLPQVFAGTTNTGKTTLMKAALSVMPNDFDIIIIQSPIEIDMPDKLMRHLMPQTGQMGLQNGDGVYVPPIALVHTSLRMAPDLVVTGEVRGQEMMAMLRAARATGMGFCFTMHVEDPQKVFKRIMDMCSEAEDFPSSMEPRDFIEQLAQSFPIVYYLNAQYVSDEHQRVIGLRRYLADISVYPGQMASDIDPVREQLFRYDETQQRLEWVKVEPHQRIFNLLQRGGVDGADLRKVLRGELSLMQVLQKYSPEAYKRYQAANL